MSDTFNTIDVNPKKKNIKRTRIQQLRIISHIVLMLLIFLHMISWYIMGIQIVGNIGIEAFFYGIARGIVNAGLVFWVLVLLSVLLLAAPFLKSCPHCFWAVHL